ncbi:hypothetical protein Y1Q_0012852 [Alligator mississippiensis]|uniref:Uncharacterized protein n=1 Tax=Alligator mississippiensis TaxID=8496 RepID=A0A151P4A1_ALLMI|nr:hypothetical protein Y1Q_0012852 [Alligator mississippiensis]
MNSPIDFHHLRGLKLIPSDKMGFIAFTRIVCKFDFHCMRKEEREEELFALDPKGRRNMRSSFLEYCRKKEILRPYRGGSAFESSPTLKEKATYKPCGRHEK